MSQSTLHGMALPSTPDSPASSRPRGCLSHPRDSGGRVGLLVNPLMHLESLVLRESQPRRLFVAEKTGLTNRELSRERKTAHLRAGTCPALLASLPYARQNNTKPEQRAGNRYQTPMQRPQRPRGKWRAGLAF